MKRTETEIKEIKKRVRDYLGYCLIYNAIYGDTSGDEDNPPENGFKLFEIIVHDLEEDDDPDLTDPEVTIRFPKDFAFFEEHPGDNQVNVTLLNDLDEQT